MPLDLIQTIAPWDKLNLGPLQNPLISDPFYMFYPYRELLTDAIRSGQLPLWNQMIMSGIPNTANPNFQLFYPPNLLVAFILPAHQALPWLAWFHLIATGWLMYLFLSQHKLHWLASLAGATAWMLNGYTLVWLENPHRLSTLTWIPGLLWAYEMAIQRKNVAWSALGGIFLGLSILGGQMQFVFAIGLIMSVYGLIGIVEAISQPQFDMGRTIAYLAIIGAIGLGIGSLALLPASEFAGISQRVRFTSETIQEARLPLHHLIALFAPDFFGNPVSVQPYWSIGNYAETTIYFGAVAFFLALTAPFLINAWRFARYALIISGMILAIVLGSPIARWIFMFPGAQFIVLTRLIFMIPLAGSWLMALALDGWLTQSFSQRRQIISVAFAIVTILILTIWVKNELHAQFTQYHSSILVDLGRGAGFVAILALFLALIPRLPKVAPLLIMALLAIDLLSWAWKFNPISSIDYLYPDNEVVNFLQEDRDLFRTLPLQSDKVVFGPNVLGVYDLQTISGYSSLIVENYQQLFKSIDNEVDISWMRPNANMLVMSHFNPLVSLLNVKYLLSARPLSFDVILLEKEEGCAESTNLTPTTVTQSFVASAPGLNRIDLFFSDAKSDSIEFWLWRDQVEGDLVAHYVIPASEIKSGENHLFYFAPVADSANQTFVWGIKSSESDAGISLCQSESGKYTFSAYANWLQHRDVLNDVWIYENPNVFPRAFLVRHVETLSEDELLTTLKSSEFNWRHTAVMTTSLPDEWQAQLSVEPVRANSDVEITNYQSDQIDIQVDTPAAGMLVLSDTFYPGWVATVDGGETPVYQVNHALRGVFVPVGNHHIQFRFRPKSVQIAMWLAGFSLLASIALIVTSGDWRSKNGKI